MLEDLFGTKTARVVEHFILHEQWEQNLKDMCGALNVYPLAMRKILNKLSKFNVIVVTRKIANSKFYKLNLDSDLVVPLRLLVQRFGAQEAEKMATKENETHAA